MRKAICCLVVSTFVLALAQTAGAITITKFEDDKAGFLAASGATSATGPLPNLGGPHATQTINTLTFSNPAGMFFQNFTNQLPGNDLAVNGADSLTIDIASPVAAFGFDWFEPDTSDSIFTATIFADLVPLTTFGFTTSQPNTGTFIGFLSDEPFNRVEIIEVQTANINEVYGEFFTAAPLVIPEPSTMTLAAMCVGGLLARRKRRVS